MRTEGSTRLHASTVAVEDKGPGSIRADAPFYNPAMGVNRDLSVLLVEAYGRQRGREIDVADCLAGTGARSVRIAKEAAVPLTVHANDGDPAAVAAIHETATANGVEDRVRATVGHAHGFLAARRYDVVDVDPFGSPMPFLDMAVHATRHDGLVCITATDTAALCGTYAKVCRRRYAANPLHAPAWRAEVGLRILQGCVVQAAGRRDRAASPVLAVARGHWMRVVMRLHDGRSAADRASKQVGFLHAHPRTGQAVPGVGGVGGVAAGDEPSGGPLWLGPLHDQELVRQMSDDAATGDRPLASPKTADLLGLMAMEAPAPPGWVPMAALPKRLGGESIPKRSRFIEALEAQGRATYRNHIDPLGIRTDASPEEVEAAWRSLL